VGCYFRGRRFFDDVLGIGLARVGGPRDLRALGAATIVTHRLQTIFVGAEHTDGTLRTKTDTASGEVTTYDYDALGNLRSVELPDTRYIEYLVDGAQRRVGRRVFDAGGTLTDEVHWLYQDALNPVAELDAQGRVLKRFVYGSKGHIPDYMVTYDVSGVETGSYRLVTDHLGSVRLVVDLSDGTVVQRMTYDTFGNVLDDTNEGFQPFGFAGGLYDAQTGLVRFGARDYDARVGRWTAKDPIGFGGGDTDLYAYVAGDPVNFIDSLGLEKLFVISRHYYGPFYHSEVMLQDDSGAYTFIGSALYEWNNNVHVHELEQLTPGNIIEYDISNKQYNDAKKRGEELKSNQYLYSPVNDCNATTSRILEAAGIPWPSELNKVKFIGADKTFRLLVQLYWVGSPFNFNR